MIPFYQDPLVSSGSTKKKECIQIIFKTVGRGTRLLAGKKTGELVDIRGPFGNGFSIPDEVRAPALIAGGIGMPPLYCLAEHLQQRTGIPKISLFYGGRTRRDLLELDAWADLGVQIYTATEDGSFGARGFITDVFREARPQLQALISLRPVDRHRCYKRFKK